MPVCGGPTDDDALSLAQVLARRHRASLEAIFVIKVKRDLPIDADMSAEIEASERLLDDVERRLEAGGDLEIESSLLQARDVGAAIVDEAVQQRADAIVLGLPYKRKFGEYAIGTVVQHVLRNAPCLVYIVRQPAEVP